MKMVIIDDYIVIIKIMKMLIIHQQHVPTATTTIGLQMLDILDFIDLNEGRSFNEFRLFSSKFSECKIINLFSFSLVYGATL